MPDYYYNKYILLWEFKQTGEVLRQCSWITQNNL